MSALRERARRHGRSMQEEIRRILARAADERAPGEPVEPLKLTTVRTGRTGTFSRDDIYGDDGR